ncbi:MAG: glycosyltransferase family 4 protein [Gemmataceae bacterium]
MRIIVNGLAAAGTRTGIGHYTTELIRCLLAQADGDTRIDLFRPDWLDRAKSVLAGMRRRAESPARAAMPAQEKAGWTWKSTAVDGLRRAGLGVFRWRFRRRARVGRYDLYHEPSFLPVDCDLPTIVTVHDLSVLLHPEWHPADRVAQHQREFQRGVSRAVHVVAISEHGRPEIIRTLGLPADRVTRTYMGVRPGLRPLPVAPVKARLRELDLPSKYLLYLGTIEPRKNVLTLLRAYCALPVPVRQRFPLVLAGGWGWNSGEVHDFLRARAETAGVIYRGYVREEDLPYLYNGARALVFPSFYEGFGLPPVEMLACGGAVLASTAGAVAETVGRKACLIEPEDVDGWTQAMSRVCRDDDWWESLRRDAVDAVRSFTWERCAADTLQVYRHVIHGSSATGDRRAAA